MLGKGLGANKLRRAGGVTLQGLYDTYLPDFMVSAENRGVVGSILTVNDYAGNHNLANPLATNLPTLVSGDADFGGRDSLDFDGIDQYLYKAVANWNSAKTQGEIITVSKTMGSINYALTSTDEATTTKTFTVSGPDDERFLQVRDATNNVVIATDGTKQSDFTTAFITAVRSDSSNYGLNLNGTEKAVSMFAGTDNGNWFSSVGNRDNIAIGGRIASTPVYWAMKWALTMEFGTPLSAGNRTALINDLKTYYGIA